MPRIHTLAGRGNIGDLVWDGGGLGRIHVLGNGGQLGLDQVRASHEVNVKDGGGAEEGRLVVVGPRDVHDVVRLVLRGGKWLGGKDEGRDRDSHGSQSSDRGKELHDGIKCVWYVRDEGVGYVGGKSVAKCEEWVVQRKKALF